MFANAVLESADRGAGHRALPFRFSVACRIAVCILFAATGAGIAQTQSGAAGATARGQSGAEAQSRSRLAQYQASLERFPATPGVDHASHRFLHDLDKGRTQVFLRNDSSSSISITEVLLNGVPLPSFYLWPERRDAGISEEKEEDERILWARVRPNPVPPGRLTEVFILWGERAERPIEVVAITSAGDKLSTIVPVEAEPQLRMTAIRFAPDHRRVFLYLKNLGKDALSLQGVFLNGLDATTQTFIGAGIQLSQSNPTAVDLRQIEPGEIKCLVVVCEHRRKEGELVFAKIVADNAADAGWARVQSEFPFGPRHTEQRFYLEYGNGVSEFAGNGREMPRFVKLEHCLTHRPEGLTWSQRARAVLAADCNCHKRLSRSLTLIHLCKARLEEGLLAFAPTCDSVLTNTNESEIRSAKETQNELETATQRLSRFATGACAPRPWFQLVMLERDERFPEFRKRLPSGPETRARIYWALASGCQGLCYRGWSGRLPPGLRSALAVVEAELAQVKDYLPYAYPVAQGECDDPKVEVCALQAGYDTVLLLVINHDFHHLLTADLDRAISWRTKRDVTIRLALPAGLTAGKAFWIHAGNKDELACTSRGREVTLSLPRLLQAELILAPLTCVGENKKGSSFRASDGRRAPALSGPHLGGV